MKAVSKVAFGVRRGSRFVWVLLALGVAGCAGSGNYVWVQELPPDAFVQPATEYLIRDGDLVNVRVFGQEPLSTRARVRSDGRIAMPAIGDVDVRGKRPSALRAELEARLKDYVNSASVTVTVEEFQPINVSVLGEVQKQGTYAVDPRTTVAQVLAAAGGLTDYASRDGLFVVRKSPRPLRIRFTYNDVRRGDPRASSFTLQAGDLLVVE